MALLMNPSVYPPDGFYFMEGSVRITAASMPKLVKAVRDYRLFHKLPPGDAAQEVNDFTCARYPVGCREGNPKYELPDRARRPAPPQGSFAMRVGKWLVDVYRAMSSSGAKLESRAIAVERAAICAKCPAQMGWATGCGGCDKASQNLAMTIRRGADAGPGSEKLLGCALLVEDTRTSVHIAGLKPVKSDKLPDFCWRKEK